MDEWTSVAVEVDGLFWVEEHVLASIHLENEVFESAESHLACNLASLVFRNLHLLRHLLRHLISVLNHVCHQFVGIHYGTFAALHLSVWQFHHTVREVNEVLAPFETEFVEQE